MVRLVVIILASVISLVPAGFAWREYVLANTSLAQASNAREHMYETITQSAGLRAMRASTSLGARPQSGIIGQVATNTTAVGLPRDIIKSVSPGAELDQGVVNGLRLRSQTMRLELEPLTLQELGRWCLHWREASPEWTIVAIDLSPISRSSESYSQQPKLRATINSQALYVEPSGDEAQGEVP